LHNSYEKRLHIPLEGNDRDFYTADNTLVATGYVQVVIGQRGPYIEFEGDHLVGDNITVLAEHAWRLNSKNCYYIELHSNDEASVKIYYQTKTVDYADYRVNYYYISPFELYDEFGLCLIEDKEN